MSTILTILPVTVIAAVVLFVLKELVEGVRRFRAERRRLQALKHLLARECERGYWAVTSLRGILVNVPKFGDENPQVAVKIETRGDGRPVARITSHDGASGSTRHVPKIHRELLSDQLLDVATMDRKLFEVYEPAYDALAELEHVRESLVSIHDEEELTKHEDLFPGFAGYALEELEKIERDLGVLYQHCTGKPLEKRRLR